MHVRGDGVKQDLYKAFHLLSKAADQGNGYAHKDLGDMYYKGDGIQQDFDLAHYNYRQAFPFIQEAAAKGYDYAQYNLGEMYLYGKGTPKDYKQAMHWLNLAASNGDREAQSLLKKIQ